MTFYWKFVAGMSGFAAVLTTMSSAYWIAVLLVVTGGIAGDCLQDLLSAPQSGPRRSRKWLLAAAALTAVGATWNIPLFIVPGATGLLAWLFARIARDLKVVQVS